MPDGDFPSQTVSKMKHETEAPQCQRADDLLAYLYDEANEAERQDFTQHLEDCAACRAELTAFRGVRGDMAAWRSEILSAAPARFVTGYADEATQQPSLAAAWAAWRGFFTLSPLWLRGATALAGLTFLGLMVFALTRGNPQPTVTATNTAAPAGVSEEEVKLRIAAAVQAERAWLNSQHAQEAGQLKEQIQAQGQQLATIQVALEKAQNNVPEPRVIKVRVPVPARSGGSQVAKGGPKPRHNTPPANNPEGETATASLSEVMFGGADGSRR
jgi:anti-sigma factor RsiW